MKPNLALVIFLAVVLLALNLSAFGQDSTRMASCADSCSDKGFHRFRATQLIAPLGLIAVGATISFTSWGQDIDNSVKGLFERDNFKQARVDDYLQFLPLVSVYALNLCGYKGRHNYRDLSIIAAMATGFMLGAVHITKELSDVWRPDGSAPNSFPSGHTAMAFVGAEILFQEYRHRSPWIGVAGYIVASGVGVMRMYNNRHWLSDVVAGAGVGILSAKAAYWIYPAVQRWLFPASSTLNGGRRLKKSKTANMSAMVTPFYNGEQVGAGVSLRF